MKKVLKADAAGFCEGVARAVESVRKRAKEGARLASLGPLVHNPTVVGELEAQGVRVISEPEECRAGETVVIRTHGVGPAVRRKIEELGAQTLDLTCPRVARVQKLVAKAAAEGRPVIIAGDPGHAESIGLKGFSEGLGTVVPGPDYAFDFDTEKSVLVVSQTTKNPESFRKVAEAVKKINPQAEVIDTICPFTVKRQEGVRNLLDKIDAAVVVGGKMSANTRRLIDVFLEARIPVQHVETEKEIDFEALKNAGTVGVAAGASTPPEVVEKVIEAIEKS